MTRSSRANPPVLSASDDPVLVKETDLLEMQRRYLDTEAKRLVMVIIPPAGPAVTIAIGHLLPGTVVVH